MGAVFPLTGFTEMPKAGSVSQQPVQQPGQQTVQQPVQQIMQPQLSANVHPTRTHPETADELGLCRPGSVQRGERWAAFYRKRGDFPGSTPQPGTTKPAQQQHQRIPQESVRNDAGAHAAQARRLTPWGFPLV